MEWIRDPHSILCELFPQVDARIIRACVLDHGNDLKSSFDFLCNEVLTSKIDTSSSIFQKADLIHSSVISAERSMAESKETAGIVLSSKIDSVDSHIADCTIHEAQTNRTINFPLKEPIQDVVVSHLDESAKASATSLMHEKVNTSVHRDEVQGITCLTEKCDMLEETQDESNSTHEEKAVSLSVVAANGALACSETCKDSIAGIETSLHLDESTQIFALMSSTIKNDKIPKSLHLDDLQEISASNETESAITVKHKEISSTQLEHSDSYLSFYAQKKCTVPSLSSLKAFSSTHSLSSIHPFLTKQSVDFASHNDGFSQHQSSPVCNESCNVTEIVAKEQFEKRLCLLQSDQALETEIVREAQVIHESECSLKNSSSVAILQGNTSVSNVGLHVNGVSYNSMKAVPDSVLKHELMGLNESIVSDVSHVKTEAVSDAVLEHEVVVLNKSIASETILNPVSVPEDSEGSQFLEDSVVLCHNDKSELISLQGSVSFMADLQIEVRDTKEAYLSTDVVYDNHFDCNHFEESSINLIEHQEDEAVVYVAPLSEENVAVALSINKDINDAHVTAMEALVNQDFVAVKKIHLKEVEETKLLENSNVLLSCNIESENVTSSQGFHLAAGLVQANNIHGPEEFADAVLIRSLEGNHSEDRHAHYIESLVEGDVFQTLGSNCANSTPCEIMNGCSTHNVNIGVFEKSFQEAKGNNEVLKDKIQDIKLLQLKLDQELVSAKQAKTDASVGGFNILRRVEEMRQLLVKAREANKMHGGEVHAEKTVLVTEARDLQLQLGQLNVEKEKTLCILNEVHTTLETRFESASKDRDAAEKEKRRKEANAHKLLATEEAMMAEVARQSRHLETEALICSKFRRYLIDRGQIIDSLKEEMKVICEEAAILKQQVDNESFPRICEYFSQGGFCQEVTHLGSENSRSNRVLAESGLKIVDEIHNLSESQRQDDIVHIVDCGNCGKSRFLVKGYLSEEIGGKKDPCNCMMELFSRDFEYHNLSKENLNMFTASAANVRLKESGPDEDGWWMLKMQSNSKGSSSESFSSRSVASLQTDVLLGS